MYEQALALCHTMAQVPDLMRALNNPVVEVSSKVELLSQATGGQMHEAFMHFIRMVFSQHREEHLPFILHSFVAHYRKQKRIYVGKLTTAIPMDSHIEELLRRKISDITQGGTIEFDIQVDSDIQGGFILQLDDLRMDASVKGQLRHIQSHLMQ